MQPAMVALLMCGTLLTSSELRHGHQPEGQLGALAKLPSSRCLAGSSDDKLEFLVQLSVLLVVHTLSLYLYYGGAYYWWDIMDHLWPSQALTLHLDFY